LYRSCIFLNITMVNESQFLRVMFLLSRIILFKRSILFNKFVNREMTGPEKGNYGLHRKILKMLES
jgi:hypothetical protein